MQTQRNDEIKYEILMSRNIVGQGSIENIKNRLLNRKFELYSDRDEFFELELRFNSPSIITNVQLRLIGTYRFVLKLMKTKSSVAQEFPQLIKGKEGIITLIPSTAQPITFVNLRIQNDPIHMKRLGISYIVFEGFSDEKFDGKKTYKDKQNKIHNIDAREIGSSMKNDPKAVNSKEIFKGRQKQKVSKTTLEKLVDFTEFQTRYKSQQSQRIKQEKLQQIRKKIKHNEDDNNGKKQTPNKKTQSKLKQKQDTQLAIALSQSERQMQEEKIYQQMQMQQMQIEKIQDDKVEQDKSLPQALQTYMDVMLEEYRERTYQTVQFNDQYISFFSDLAPKWLEAQRKAQEQANVREEQRLSKYIRLKYLNGTQIYIEGFSDWKIDEIKHQAKDLGCKVLSELKNHCLAIVTKNVCQKLRKKHKDWQQVRYLTPQYLEDCIKHQSKLSPKDYYIRI